MITTAVLRRLHSELHTVSTTAGPFNVEGVLSEHAAREIKLRVKVSLAQLGEEPTGVVRITPNVDAWAYSLDVPVAIAAMGLKMPEDTVFVGELSLDGTLRPVRGIISMTQAALEGGFKNIVVPAGAARAAACVEGINVWAARELSNILYWVSTGTGLEFVPTTPLSAMHQSAPTVLHESEREIFDAFSNAVLAGAHTMLCGSRQANSLTFARRAAALLAPMTKKEILSVATVRDAAGLDFQLGRPFRAPHNSISVNGMLGTKTLAGELDLARGGILVLDDFANFSLTVLDCMSAYMQKDAGLPVQLVLISPDMPEKASERAKEVYTDRLKRCLNKLGQDVRVFTLLI